MADDAWLAARAEKSKYEQKHREAESLYNQQINLNQRYEQANVRIRDLVQEKKNEAVKFQEEKRLLLETAENQKKIIAEKNKIIDSLRNLCRDIYSSFANAMKAVKMLKNKKSKYYVDNISEDISRLIDSVVDYSADWAKADGYPDIARDMRDNSEISEGIQKWIDEKTPKVKSHTRSL
jgi:archaellum component FlaC